MEIPTCVTVVLWSCVTYLVCVGLRHGRVMELSDIFCLCWFEIQVMMYHVKLMISFHTFTHLPHLPLLTL